MSRDFIVTIEGSSERCRYECQQLVWELGPCAHVSPVLSTSAAHETDLGKLSSDSRSRSASLVSPVLQLGNQSSTAWCMQRIKVHSWGKLDKKSYVGAVERRRELHPCIELTRQSLFHKFSQLN